MIRNIGITIATILLFAVMAWTTIAATPSDTENPVVHMQVQYDLPYPGILPNSPLYPLKAFRDKLISFFITDAKKQAQFDLLQADKRLVAGEYMLEEQKPNTALVSQTISKGQNYFADAITNIVTAKKQGQLVNDFFNTLHDASIKHQQVLLGLSAKTQGQLHQDLQKDISQMQEYQNQVEKLIQQK